jgi:hypothetical protein
MSQKLSQSLGSSVDQTKKNPNFAAIFWPNHGVKHRSPFVKVGAGRMSYNFFFFWRLSSLFQTF